MLVGRRAASAVLLLALPVPALAQQETVQVSSAVHSLSGASERLGTQPTFEPDLGISWLRTGTRFGTFRLELRGTTRDGRAHLGRTLFSLSDLTAGGVRYAFDFGDSIFSPKPGDYQFRNLYTPALNFSGASMRARAAWGEASLMAGRATTTRNMFGSDVKTLDQTLLIGTGRHQASDRLEITGRASRIRTRDLDHYRFAIAASDQAGAGARFLLTPSLHLVGDASLVSWRARGDNERHVDASALAGASLLLARGWAQVNVSRFSPGELPILAQPFADRRTMYAAGEYDLPARVRVFGGWESFRASMDARAPTGSPTEGGRAFGGVRVPLGPAASASFRVEDGDRRSRLTGPSQIRTSDTGVVTWDVQAAVGRLSAFGRVARRENVESEFESATYTQREAAALAFYSFNRGVQVFGSLTGILNETAAGDSDRSWQVGGGAQSRFLRRNLWIRGEALFTRSVDQITERVTPQQTVNFGLNGEFARDTVISLNLYADRLQTGLEQPLDSWLLRSTVRLTRTFTSETGVARTRLGITSRHGGTGSIKGLVYTDWNGNGLRDPDETPIANIPVRLSDLGSTSTSAAGEFAFINVPIGLQQVGIEVASLPVDFDVPRVPQVQLDLRRGDIEHLTFGLVPLGSISGRVVRDADGNGAVGAEDEPVDGAVVVLDGGLRSEQVRDGTFRFDAVPSGTHQVTLLSESLPEGAAIAGPPTLDASLGRDNLAQQVAFLVALQERPEVRRVFPSGAPRAGAAPSMRPPAPPRARARGRSTPPRAGSVTPGFPTEAQFVVQVAALNDPNRASALVDQLRAAGWPAYMVAPPPHDPDAPVRVRVGPFESRAAAEREARVLGAQLGERMWVVRER